MLCPATINISEDMPNAVTAVKLSGISQLNAAKRFNVPQRTLSDKLAQRHERNVGRPSVLEMDALNNIMGIEGLNAADQNGVSKNKKLYFCHFPKKLETSNICHNIYWLSSEY